MVLHLFLKTNSNIQEKDKFGPIWVSFQQFLLEGALTELH